MLLAPLLLAAAHAHVAAALQLLHPPPGAALPALRPIGRTFYSSDPAASAAFYKRYFHARDVNVSFSGGCSDAAAVELRTWKEVEPCPHGDPPQRMLYTFVKDPLAKPLGNFTVAQAIEAATRIDGRILGGDTNYSEWFDLHDGHTMEMLDVHRLFDDKVPLLYYWNILRLSVPGTMWTAEIASPPEDNRPDENALLLPVQRFPPDFCRKSDKWPPRRCTGRWWWKSTFAAADPGAAAAFAVQVLGGEVYEAAYEWPPAAEGCIGAMWVTLPGSNFKLHFVKSSGAWPPNRMSVDKVAALVEEKRDLPGGVFDQFLYNSLVFEAASLDPFVLRLTELGLPFLPLRLGSGGFALFMDIPKNGISVQIRSAHLTAAAPRDAPACVW